MSCADVQAGAALPLALELALPPGELNDIDSPCDDRSRLEGVIAWTAPKTGRFVIDTARSVSDTVLSVRTGGCGGAVLACDDNGISYGGASKVVVDLVAGQQIAIVFEDGGSFNYSRTGYLHINEVEAAESAASCFDGADNDADSKVDCADADCAATSACAPASCSSVSAATVPFDGHVMLGTKNDFQLSCNGDSGQTYGGDSAIRFTAPVTGDYLLWAYGGDDPLSGTTATTLLTACRSAERVCATAPNGKQKIRARLNAGETVLFVIEGYGGADVAIDAVRANETGEACQDGWDNDDDGKFDEHDTDCGGI